MNDVETPDYLPARMLNEFVYCPRLFYYEWVEGVFAHNRETVEGALRHAKIDDRQDELTPAAELTTEDRLHSRSVTLSSDAHGLIAKLDLIEVADGCCLGRPVSLSPRQRTPAVLGDSVVGCSVVALACGSRRPRFAESITTSRRS